MKHIAIYTSQILRGVTLKKELPNYLERKKVADKRYVPYIPPQFVVETVKFLQNKANINSLLKLIFSPRNSNDTVEDRKEYTRNWEKYKEEKRLFNSPYRHQEKLAEISMWNAINSLPSDLYDEAVAPSSFALPLSLRFHFRYRHYILGSLSNYELRCLQVFQNLMYIRFPFNEARKKRPGLFWITQLGGIHRARIAALSKSLIKWK